MNPKLKEALPAFNMASIPRLDRGAVERRVNQAITQVLANIATYPFRDGGKTEVRKVTLEILVTPELREVMVGTEVGGRQTEVKSFELSGITVRCKVKSALPDAETGDVRMLCDIQNGVFKDVRFNPENNHRPEQLELDLDDDE